MKRAALATLLIASSVLAPSAFAGSKAFTQVWVDTVGRYAAAGFGGARNSSDDRQYASCELYANSSPNTVPFASCYFANANGVSAYCWSSDDRIVKVLQGITSDSYVYVGWDTHSMCSFVNVRAGSQFEPKQP